MVRRPPNGKERTRSPVNGPVRRPSPDPRLRPANPSSCPAPLRKRGAAFSFRARRDARLHRPFSGCIPRHPSERREAFTRSLSSLGLERPDSKRASPNTGPWTRSRASSREDRTRWSLGESGARPQAGRSTAARSARTRTDPLRGRRLAAVRRATHGDLVGRCCSRSAGAFVRKDVGDAAIEQGHRPRTWTRSSSCPGSTSTSTHAASSVTLAAVGKAARRPWWCSTSADLDPTATRAWMVEALAPGAAVLAVSALEGDGIAASCRIAARRNHRAVRSVRRGQDNGRCNPALLGAGTPLAPLMTARAAHDDASSLSRCTGGAAARRQRARSLGDEDSVMRFEIASLAEGCRFRDCRHESWSGCVVLAAGEADARVRDRLSASWRSKLQRGGIWFATQAGIEACAAAIPRFGRKAIH